jgi:transcriptional regulator with XRE-family HTH domain
MTPTQTWSAWVRAMLDETGMSPAELAKRVGTRQSTVSRWLSGETDQPSFTLVIDVGVVFGQVTEALRAARYRPDLLDNGGIRDEQDPSQAV